MYFFDHRMRFLRKNNAQIYGKTEYDAHGDAREALFFIFF